MEKPNTINVKTAIENFDKSQFKNTSNFLRDAFSLHTNIQYFPQGRFCMAYRHALKIPRHSSHIAVMLPAMHAFSKAQNLL